VYPTKVDWQIPLRGEKGEWYPVIRVGRHVPFGYKQDEEDEMLLLPIPEELELLEKAKLFLTEYSTRQVAQWLSKESGRYISHVGLNKRVRMEEKRRRSSSTTESMPFTKKRQGRRRRSKKKDLVAEPIRNLDYEDDYIQLSEESVVPSAVKQEVIFQPNEGPQTRFLAATEQEVLYGGAAGGGKSYAMVADPVRYFLTHMHECFLFVDLQKNLENLSQ
jgi:hypothetical protein